MNIPKTRFAFGCLLLFGAAELHAQVNYSWDTSSTTGTWSTTTDWTPNAPTGGPTSVDSIITPTLVGALNLIATQSVTNWTFNPTTNISWMARAGSSPSALSISNTLTVDDGGQSGATTEMIFEDSSATNTLTFTAGAVNVNNARLYIGGASGSGGSIFSATVSGLTTIGGSTNNTTARLSVALDGVSGNTANFAGGVAFGTGANSTTPEDFYFNGTANSASASVGFLSGGSNKYAVIEGSGTGALSTLNINGASGTNTFGGIIQDFSGTALTAVQMTGGVTQILTFANTYSGGTTINGGNLQLANTTGSATGTGAVALIGNTATVSGTGTSTGLLTVTAGGRIAPGANTTNADGSGRLNFGVAGTLTLGSTGNLKLTNANLDLDLSNSHASGNDLIATGGALTLGTLAVNINELNGTLETGTLYTLISGATSETGFNASNISTSFLNGTTYTPTYSLAGNSLDVSFSVAAVPEPSTWTAGVFCAAIAAFAYRRRLAKA